MKNKIILGIILGMFLIGLVSAGITGYVLSRGQLVPGTSTQIESVNAQTSSIVVDGEKVRTGETFTRAGKTYEVVAVEKPFFWSKPKVEIQEASGSGAETITSVTEEECSDNCESLIERYKLDEGETISINGNQISIDYIDADSTVLLVNGVTISEMSKDQWFELSNGQIVLVEKIRRLEVGGEIGYVILSIDGYKLDEGETLNMAGDIISIDFIDATTTILTINGQNTNQMSKGQWVELSNGQILNIEKVAKLEVAGTTGYVRLSLASCYFPYL